MCKETNIPQGCRPFNLEEALAGKPVVTRDGRSVKIAGYNPEAEKYETVIGWAHGLSKSWSDKGVYILETEHQLDLFMAPEAKDVWVVLWVSDGVVYSCAFEKLEDAKEIDENNDKMPHRQSLGIHKITVTI